jgi:phytol kinase
VSRKLFHIGGGALGVALPWLFDNLLPVLVLGLLIGGVFLAIRSLPVLRDSVGQVFLAVQRQSIGEFGFLASFCLLFWLSRGDKLLYTIPIMMVVLADALAALVGRTYGRYQLHMTGDRKSIEGTVAFFLIAFFCVHIPVLLWGETGRLESLLIALNVSAMVMLAEAAAWWGLDNLIIPVWGYILLKSLLLAGSAGLVGDFAFLASLTAFMYYWRSRATLGDDALAGAVLWGYVVWSVGGLPWTIAPLLQFATYATLTVRTPLDQVRNLPFPVVLANIAASIPWLLAYRQTGDAELFTPFAACFGANLAIIALTRVKFAYPHISMRSAVAAGVATGMIIVLPSLLAVYWTHYLVLTGAAAALIAISVAAGLFYRLQPRLPEMPIDYGRWLRQALITGAGSVIAFGIDRGLRWALHEYWQI